MSNESLAIFNRALYDGEASPDELSAAAVEHLNCSRSLAVLTAEYAQALDAGNHARAQSLAEELVSVRQAGRVAGVPDGMD